MICNRPDSTPAPRISQIKAELIWEDFRRDDLKFTDLVEACAALLYNVADRAGATDTEILATTARLIAAQRTGQKAQVPSPQFNHSRS